MTRPLTASFLASAVLAAALSTLGGLPGCSKACQDGYTENENGECLRNRYGSSDTAADDSGDNGGNGGSGGSAPEVTLTQGRYGTDADGVPFLEVELTAFDAEGDIPDGNIHILLDGTGNYDRPIIEGTSNSEDYTSAQFNNPDLWFWIPHVDMGDHETDVTVSDAAGNVSPPLTLTFSSTPQ